MHFSQKFARVYRPFRLFSFFMIFCVARTFCFKRHLDVVLEVLQRWLDKSFLFTKLVDIYHRKTHWIKIKNDCFINEGDIQLFELWKKKKKKQELQEVLVSNWDILEFRSQFEIRTFIFLNTLDYGTLINKEIESISNNFDVLCWNSPRCCPWGSRDMVGLDWKKKYIEVSKIFNFGNLKKNNEI